jgi:hypothetical protein
MMRACAVMYIAAPIYTLINVDKLFAQFTAVRESLYTVLLEQSVNNCQFEQRFMNIFADIYCFTPKLSVYNVLDEMTTKFMLVSMKKVWCLF